MSEDLFEKIIAREIPAEIVYETETVLAFRDINPQAPTHILIIPKEKIRTINDISDHQTGLIGELYLAARDIAKQAGFADEGYRVVMNCGEAAGQAVWHIHLHLLAGRALTWPPG
ncbi:MAG: histidine triad nucleotide-binding protein [Xanthomonadales bacterium]|nr:histidine triad nucleotide-binding protein [Xanthomonadales bacterium]